MEYIDLTHTFTDTMPVYPGDPRPKLEPVADFATEGFVDHRLTVTMHVGTHMDAPLHMIENGDCISDIGPEKFFGRGVLVDARAKKTVIDESLLGEVKLNEGDMVLVYTGWSKYFRHEDYFKDFPEISTGFAQALVDAKVAALGLDTPTPDRAPFLVHKTLLSQKILLLENLTNLKQLLEKKFEVIALPVKFRTDGAPCRVIAHVK